MSTHDIDSILENYVRGCKILLVVRKAFYICFLMHWTQGIWLQEKIDQNYNSYFVVIMWGHLIMGEQVKERLGSLTTMAINHHKACTFRISCKNQCSQSLKKIGPCFRCLMEKWNIFDPVWWKNSRKRTLFGPSIVYRRTLEFYPRGKDGHKELLKII